MEINKYIKKTKPSYYKANQKYNIPVKELNKDVECDICIIGAGLTGLSCALELANLGYKKVIVLEAETVVSGASGVNGGQVLNGYNCSFDHFEHKFGKKKAYQLWQIAHQGLNLIKDNIDKYKIDCEWENGVGVVAYKRGHMLDLKYDYNKLINEYNYPSMKLYDEKELENIIHSTKKYYGLLYDELAGHLNPLNYTLALADICLNKGVTIYQLAKANKIKLDKAGYKIKVNKKIKVSARKVILAANMNNAKIYPQLNGRSISINIFMAATNQLDPDVAKSIISNKMAIFDSRYIMDYYRITKDNRLIFGGGDSFFAKKNINSVLKRNILKIFPQLHHIKLEYLWSGKEGLTMNLLPDIGQIGDNLYYAQGFSGHGMALASISGTLIARNINEPNDDFALLSSVNAKVYPIFKSNFINSIAIRIVGIYYKVLDVLPFF